MSRSAFKTIQEEKYFRWRGKEVSRTENLSDIVFAMALTLIVASSVPASFTELANLWRETIAIGLYFSMLLIIWHIHYVFFRRYDLEDGTTILYNSILMFLVMVFAYPLKFLASFIVNFFTGGFASEQSTADVLSIDQTPWLTAIYSIGYAAVFGLFALMYTHALKRADDIGLNRAEQVLTRAVIKANIAHVCIALLVILLAFTLPGNWGTMAGAFYGLIGIPLTILGRRSAIESKAAFEAEENI